MVNIHFVKEELAITKEINNLMKGVSKKERLELENIFRKNRLEDLVKEHKQLFVKTTPKHNMHTRQYTDDDAEFMEKELHRFFQEGTPTSNYCIQSRDN